MTGREERRGGEERRGMTLALLFFHIAFASSGSARIRETDTEGVRLHGRC